MGYVYSEMFLKALRSYLTKDAVVAAYMPAASLSPTLRQVREELVDEFRDAGFKFKGFFEDDKSIFVFQNQE